MWSKQRGVWSGIASVSRVTARVRWFAKSPSRKRRLCATWRGFEMSEGGSFSSLNIMDVEGLFALRRYETEQQREWAHRNEIAQGCREHAHADGVTEDTWSIFIESGVEIKKMRQASLYRGPRCWSNERKQTKPVSWMSYTHSVASVSMVRGLPFLSWRALAEDASLASSYAMAQCSLHC